MTDAYTNASKLIASLRIQGMTTAQDVITAESEKNSTERHSPELTNVALTEWLRSLPKLTQEQIYNSSWKD